MQENFNNFVGLKWKFNGRDSDGVDCVGLAAYVYSCFGWKQQWTDGKPVDKDWYNTSPLRLLLYLRRNFIPTKDKNELKFGDIIYMKINGEGHIGIYESYGYFISIMPSEQKSFGGFSFRERLSKYETFVVSYFKR